MTTARSESAFERFLQAIEQSGRSVKRHGDGRAQVQCPGHDDHNPSLSVTHTEGTMLLHCHAGCAVENVLSALSLTKADLYDNRRGVQYRYDDGRIVHRSAAKEFRQSGNLKHPELYRLAKVKVSIAAGEVIYVVEGEKDVNALASIGVTATCNPMGAGQWAKIDPSPLYGAAGVVIVADRDEKGLRHAKDVHASLVDHVTVVRVVHAKTGKDAADHLAAGHGPLDFEPVPVGLVRGKAPARQIKVTWADSIRAKRVNWFWQTDGRGRIPLGTFSVGAGREGTCKSSCAIWMTARVTTGTLPGCLFGQPRRVLFVAVEDSWEHTIVPRLIAAGADLSMVGRADVAKVGDDDLMLSLPEDLAELERTIREHDVALVVLDPLLSMIGEHIDTHRNREVREALDPLARLADRTRAVLFGIAHFGKARGTDAATLITGSGAFKDVPRTVFGFAQDDEGGVMTQVKNSLGRLDLPSLSYAMTPVLVLVEDGTDEVGMFEFTGESTRTVEDMLRDSHAGGEEQAEGTEANEWLTNWLAGQRGEGLAGDAIKAALNDGIAKRTLQRARKRAGITAVKDGFGGSWIWRLPAEGAAQDAVGAKSKVLAPTAPSQASSPPAGPSQPASPVHPLDSEAASFESNTEIRSGIRPSAPVSGAACRPRGTAHTVGQSVLHA